MIHKAKKYRLDPALMLIRIYPATTMIVKGSFYSILLDLVHCVELIFLSIQTQLKSFFAADEARVSFYEKKLSRGYFLLVFVATWLKTDII